MKIHFISIGGAVMHNLAIALSQKGYQITGSDDQIYDPSKSRLEKEGILPESWGWFPEKVTADLDAVILGMHARADNPELKKAEELGLKVYSFPEYIYEHSKNKTRVVIGGSHGKTTTTSMVMHVLQEQGMEFDYLVGAQLEGFDLMVKLSDTAKIIVIEGDEYLTSPIDRRPKFHLYHPHITSITGIAWDHINVFPTLEMYEKLFSDYVEMVDPEGALFYFEGDAILKKICEESSNKVPKQSYTAHPHKVDGDQTFLLVEGQEIPLHVFGTHNMENLSAAQLMCRQLGISDTDFYAAIATFRGAAKRLQTLEKSKEVVVFQDFAHSPSKLKATTAAVKEQYAEKTVVACMELHTFSSLKADFLDHYKDSMEKADLAMVYFSPDTIAHKKLEAISPQQVKEAFGRDDLWVFTESQQLQDKLKSLSWKQSVLLLMSSGTFGGMNLKEFAQEIVNLSKQ